MRLHYHVLSCYIPMQKVVLYNWNEEAVVGKYKGPEKDITQVSYNNLCATFIKQSAKLQNMIVLNVN